MPPENQPKGGPPGQCLLTSSRTILGFHRLPPAKASANQERRMASRTFALEPKAVKPVQSPFRTIRTKIPVPESVPVLETLRQGEPLSMTGQPAILWESAQGCLVKDRWGNQWLDWSSGVLVANAGHGRKEIVDAIVKQATAPLLHNYCFPNEARAELSK